jgi:hypothetical protein
MGVIWKRFGQRIDPYKIIDTKVHDHLDRKDYCSMEIEWILTFKKWTRTIDWQTTNQGPKRGGETGRGIGAGTTFGGARRGGDEK